MTVTGPEAHPQQPDLDRDLPDDAPESVPPSAARVRPYAPGITYGVVAIDRDDPHVPALLDWERDEHRCAVRDDPDFDDPAAYWDAINRRVTDRPRRGRG
jgi:hypothetical protein